MIDPTLLPSWSELYARFGGPPPKRNRGQCLIHGGDSLTSVSLDHDRGLYYCHVCGLGGDRVDWIKRMLDTDFNGVLCWIGIQSGQSPAADPERLRNQQEQRKEWDQLLRRQRELRAELRFRNFLERIGVRRLRDDENDALGWELLDISYSAGRPIGAIETELDALLEVIPREAYCKPEDKPGYQLTRLLQQNALSQRRRTAA